MRLFPERNTCRLFLHTFVHPPIALLAVVTCCWKSYMYMWKLLTEPLKLRIANQCNDNSSNNNKLILLSLSLSLLLLFANAFMRISIWIKFYTYSSYLFRYMLCNPVKFWTPSELYPLFRFLSLSPPFLILSFKLRDTKNGDNQLIVIFKLEIFILLSVIAGS